MRKSELLLILLFCLCLVGCSKGGDFVNVSGAFGTGETGVSESSITESITESSENKFAIKDEVVLSTENNIVESSGTDISLNNLQEAKIFEIEQNLKSSNSEITEEDVIELLNTDDFVNLSDKQKSLLATEIKNKTNNSTTSETLDSNLVYKHATSYETDEIIIDEEAPTVVYSEEELEFMHSEAEELYQQQQAAETFEFDD